MNVIELAKQAGAYTDCIGEHTITSNASIENFATLVRAAAIEEAAKAVDEIHLFAVGAMREFEAATLQDAARTIRSLKEKI